MTLHDMIQQDAVTVFCNLNDFAETAVYYPHTGDARTINVVNVREALALSGEDNDNVIPLFEIHVANNETTGILSSELNLGGDMIEFSLRVGKAVSKRSITKLLSHDEGMLVLECR
jgi:hypothetical protein